MKVSILNYTEPIWNCVARGLKQLGHEVDIMDVEHLSFENICSRLEAFKPHLCLTNNFYVFDIAVQLRDRLENYFEQKRIPLASWYVEVPHLSGTAHLKARWHVGPRPKNVFFLCSEHQSVDFFERRELAAAYLPLGVDETVAEFRPDSKFKRKLAFSGRPFFKKILHHFTNVDAERNAFTKIISAEFVELFRSMKNLNLTTEQLEVWKATVRELLEGVFQFPFLNGPEYRKARHHFMLEFAKKLPADITEAFEVIMLGRLDYLYSHFQLSCYLDRLTPFGVSIYGGDSWNKLVPRYTEKSESLSQEDLQSLFGASDITFCLTKQQFHGFVHDRVFQVLALGGFPITDYRAELDEMFESGEVVSYRSIDELESLVAYYLNHETERKAISARARARVLKQHTYFERTKKLVELTQNHFGLPA